MSRAIRMMCVLSLVVTPVLAHGADSGTPAASSPATATAAAKPDAKPAAKPGAKPGAKPSKSTSKKSRTTTQKANPSTVATEAAARSAGPRRLEDIHIEGEVPVPQVLFITARDQRRFLESHHDLYLRTSRELGEATPLPARVVLTPGKPAPVSAPARTEDGR